MMNVQQEKELISQILDVKPDYIVKGSRQLAGSALELFNKER